MANAATRLITLIMLLQRQPNQKAADLARALGVSVRSLHRYIAMLDEMGAATVIVSGVETDVCVLATVMSAMDRGYRVVVPSDAVHGSDAAETAKNEIAFFFKPDEIVG